MITEENSLILPPHSHVAVFRAGSDGYVVESAPRWLTSSLGLEHQFPMTASSNNTLEKLASIAGDIEKSGLALENFLMETVDETGRPLAILMRGKKENGAVTLAMRDVTEIVRARRQAAAIGAFHGLVGNSLPMLELYHRIATYGPTDAPILITGETGSGKELVARALHERSKRGEGPFVAVNCSALTPELFESELFGHEKGYFTGAFRQHRGRFERADNGTLLLDEIGDMPPMTQSKMLRALEEGVIERVGSEREHSVDVRVVAATNVPLEQAVAVRRFRADLYHRLSVLRVHVPPLREREGDIPLLVDHYLEQFNRRYSKQVKRLTPEAMRVLEEYHWPGNVRELRNVIERLVVESAGEAIGARALHHWREEREFLMPGSWNADAMYAPRAPIYAPAGAESLREVELPQSPMFPSTAVPLSQRSWGDFSGGGIIEARPLPADPPVAPAELTRESIGDAFARSGGNLTRAAADLGVHKATLYRHMKKLGLSREELDTTQTTGE